jgi:hypothetical protein
MSSRQRRRGFSYTPSSDRPEKQVPATTLGVLSHALNVVQTDLMLWHSHPLVEQTYQRLVD